MIMLCRVELWMVRMVEVISVTTINCALSGSSILLTESDLTADIGYPRKSERHFPGG